MSRPSSAVAYTRPDHLPPAVYAGSPTPEQGMGSLSHPEAMERFTVCLLTADVCFLLTRVQDHRQRSRESCRSAAHYFTLSAAFEPRYSPLGPPGALHRCRVGRPPPYSTFDVSEDRAIAVQDIVSAG